MTLLQLSLDIGTESIIRVVSGIRPSMVSDVFFVVFIFNLFLHSFVAWLCFTSLCLLICVHLLVHLSLQPCFSHCSII